VLIRAGKTSRERALPVPEDAGAALARYLRDVRPVSSERAVFLRLVPPHKPLRSVGIVIDTVNRLLRQAGIGAPCSGAYVFRHTLATTMAPLPSRLLLSLPWRYSGKYPSLARTLMPLAPDTASSMVHHFRSVLGGAL